MIFSIVNTEEGIAIIERYERLMNIFSEKEENLFVEWAEAVPRTVDAGLDCNLMIRDRHSVLRLNFDPDLLAILKEVNYLKHMSRSEIPQEALEVDVFLS